MLSSVPLMSLFTVLFRATGVYSVVRLAALASGLASAVDRPVDRAAELSHVLMSVAMIAMAWGWSGGPSSPSGILQIVAFGLAGAYFLCGAVFGYRTPLAGGYHLVMALAMVWMVVTMPLLMGAAGSSGAAMEGMPWMAGGGAGAAGPDAGARRWVLPISLVLVALLVGATLFWAARARKPVGEAGHCTPVGEAGHCAPVGEAGDCAPGGHRALPGAPAGSPEGGVLLAPARVESLLSPRADAACHALMSAGMAGMLAAML
jgi:hypothetical protein